jgi:hypothetical protein
MPEVRPEIIRVRATKWANFGTKQKMLITASTAFNPCAATCCFMRRRFDGDLVVLIWA